MTTTVWNTASIIAHITLGVDQNVRYVTSKQWGNTFFFCSSKRWRHITWSILFLFWVTLWYLYGLIMKERKAICSAAQFLFHHKFESLLIRKLHCLHTIEGSIVWDPNSSSRHEDIMQSKDKIYIRSVKQSRISLHNGLTNSYFGWKISITDKACRNNYIF